jgi:fructose-bisphosphate aldolase class I
MNQEQLTRMKVQPGFVAALDQSGGSTPKALADYGIGPKAWSNEEEMFDLVHQMRTRVIASPGFTGDRIIGAILFEGTMMREIEGQPSADFLWNVKRVVPFLKVDKGLAEEKNGVRLMKPMPQLAALLATARAKNVFGTKMRSVINLANPAGIREVVRQQFEVAAQIAAADLVPIVEPEVDIHSPEKAKAEELLKSALLEKLGQLPSGQSVFLKVARVLALSGGYSRADADRLLRRNHGVVASFSRALLEGLSASQSSAEFDATLGAAIQGIYEASVLKLT